MHGIRLLIGIGAADLKHGRLDSAVPSCPLPPHFDRRSSVGEVWRVPYEERAPRRRRRGRESTAIRPAARTSVRICLLAVDVQNTFCTPGFELFVAAGRARGRRQPAALRVRLPQPRRDHADRPDARHAPGAADLPRGLARRRRRAPSGAVHARLGRGRRERAAGGRPGRAELGLRRHLRSSYVRARWPTGGKYELTSGRTTRCSAGSATRSSRRSRRRSSSTRIARGAQPRSRSRATTR